MRSQKTRVYRVALALAVTWGWGVHSKAIEPKPPSPTPSEWAFIDALSEPLIWMPHWKRDQKKQGEASLQRGVRVEADFPDQEGVLETAYQDLDAFFSSVGVPAEGPYRIVTERIPTQRFETFKLVVGENECRIQAGDTEGIRRGIFFAKRADTCRGPFSCLGRKGTFAIYPHKDLPMLFRTDQTPFQE